MKTTLLLLCMAVLGTLTVSAQAPTKKSKLEVKAKTDADKLAKELGLDKKQHEKLYAANLEFEKEWDKVNNTKLSNDAKLIKKEALRQKQLDHLKTVLKPEQYNKVAAKLGHKPQGKSKLQPKSTKDKSKKKTPEGKKKMD